MDYFVPDILTCTVLFSNILTVQYRKPQCHVLVFGIDAKLFSLFGYCSALLFDSYSYSTLFLYSDQSSTFFPVF